jgi:hypothetical protein
VLTSADSLANDACTKSVGFSSTTLHICKYREMIIDTITR